MKAEFKERLKGYRDIFGRPHYDILVYTYRGHEYEIEDLPAYKQPAWYFKNAHAEEQRRIDRIIESEERNKANEANGNTETVQDSLDWLFEQWGW